MNVLPPMETLAERFDAPINSPEHQDLATTAWMGGESVAVRFYLGRLTSRNLFRESDEAVADALEKWCEKIGHGKGAPLGAVSSAWTPLSRLLRHEFELQLGITSQKNAKWRSAMRAVLSDPELTLQQIAKIANTTEKQVAKMSDVTYLQILWKRHVSEMEK